MDCAVVASKLTAFNSSAASCLAHQGSIVGTIITLCRPQARASGSTASSASPLDSYAQELRTRYIRGRRLKGASLLIRSLALINAVGTPFHFQEAAIVEDALSDRRVASVQVDCTLQLDEPPLAAASTALSDLAEAVPWGLDRIDARQGLDGHYDAGSQRGRDSTIYVLDTGVRTSHTEFGGRARAGWSARCNSGDRSGCANGRWVTGGDITAAHVAAHGACSSHGTHVASTAAGAAYGVAKAASVVAVQALDCTGSGSTSSVLGVCTTLTVGAPTLG